MSARRTLERRLHSLVEIGEIMNAMKNMALMETHKLAGRVEAQNRAAASIDAAVDEFLACYAGAPGAEAPGRDVCLLVGSERGFCGDFNGALLRSLAGLHWPGGEPALVVVGRRLASAIGDDPRVAARIEGAGSLESIGPVLLNVMDALATARSARAPDGDLRVTVLHHEDEAAAPAVTRLDPRAARATRPPQRGYAPLLNLAPDAYFAKLAEHHLLFSLQAIFWRSLMAENRRRAQHMDNAVRRVEENARALERERNALRQEEITEEIEVIMLSADPVGDAPAR